jgi:putative endonuclease
MRPDTDNPAHGLGRHGEDIAREYLLQQGMRIKERGFRFGRGEIDIIGYDQDTLVFVEVKARRLGSFSDPEEAVTPAKQKQIRRIAQAYLFLQGLEDVRCRFDVLALEIGEEGNIIIRHHRDAFD